jgi:hypothetical protein
VPIAARCRCPQQPLESAAPVAVSVLAVLMAATVRLACWAQLQPVLRLVALAAWEAGLVPTAARRDVRAPRAVVPAQMRAVESVRHPEQRAVCLALPEE